MFKYNELSDLLNGELVVPIKKEGDKILCLKDGKEVTYSFDDFDFDKTIEERNFIVVDDSSDEDEIISDDSNDNSEDTIETIKYSFIDNLLKIKLTNHSNINITLINNTIIKPMEEKDLNVFETSPLYEQIKNLEKRLIITFEIISANKEKHITERKTFTLKKDPHYSSDAVALAEELGYKPKNYSKVNAWTDYIN